MNVMNNTTLPKVSTKCGNWYEIPRGVDAETFYEIIYEVVKLAKDKGLTVRQAQLLFKACGDYVLESKLV